MIRLPRELARQGERLQRVSGAEPICEQVGAAPKSSSPPSPPSITCTPSDAATRISGSVQKCPQPSRGICHCACRRTALCEQAAGAHLDVYARQVEPVSELADQGGLVDRGVLREYPE